VPTTDAADLPPVRRLSLADLPALIELRATVMAGLPPGFVWPRTEAQLRAYLDGAGAAFGVSGSDGALDACALLRFPGAGRANPTPAFPLVPGADWPLRACGLEGTVVRPAVRGRGLQRALVDARLACAAQAGMRWTCAGVRLENAVSWANLLARGLAIVGMRSDPGYPILGLLRPLGPRALWTDPGDRVLVGVADAARHRAVLDAGYIGVRLEADESVAYERLVTRPGTPRPCGRCGR
jgi:GNAT superfamily N-acetyltransferase